MASKESLLEKVRRTCRECSTKSPHLKVGTLHPARTSSTFVQRTYSSFLTFMQLKGTSGFFSSPFRLLVTLRSSRSRCRGTVHLSFPSKTHPNPEGNDYRLPVFDFCLKRTRFIYRRKGLDMYIRLYTVQLKGTRAVFGNFAFQQSRVSAPSPILYERIRTRKGPIV